MPKVVRLGHPQESGWEECLSGFLLWKKAQGVSGRTCADYDLHVRMFMRKHPNSWPDNLEASLIRYMAEDIAPATYNLRRAYLGGFLAYCVREEALSRNPMAGFPKRKDTGHFTPVDPGTITALVGLPDRQSFAGLRDYALILFTLDTAARPGEALSILPGHLALGESSVALDRKTTKTRAARTLPISPPVADLLHRLLLARHRGWGEKVPVFCTYDGRPMQVRTWSRRLAEYSKQLPAKVTPYSLRHTSATEWVKAGGNVHALRHILGHAGLHMALRYVHLADSDVRDQHAQAGVLDRLGVVKNRVRKVKK